MKKLYKNQKYFYYYSYIITVVLLCISIYRAYTSGITYDEAATYLIYIKENPISTALSMKNNIIPNNHILNTLAISFMINITGTRYSELIIRIPNLISYIFYFIFAYQISKNNKNNFLLFSILSFNYGLNEYASLARGYCMATCFVMLAILFFDYYLKNNEFKYINYCLYAFILACYSNTVTLIIYFCFLILIITNLYINKQLANYIKNNYKYLFSITLLSIFIIIIHFLSTVFCNAYIYGGTSTFFKDFLCSIFSMYGFFVDYGLFQGHIFYIINYKCIIILFLFLILIIIINLNKLKKNYYFYSFPLCVLIIITATTLTNSKWLTGRLTIPFIPVFSIWIIEIINCLSITKIKKRTYELLIIIFLIISFMRNTSTNYTRDFNRDVIIKTLSYEAYKTNDNTRIKEFKYELKNDYSDYQPPLEYYKQKFLIEYNYDIST